MSIAYLRIAALSLLAVSVLYFIFRYNSFVRLRQEIYEALSNVQVQLKRRHNIVGSLLSLLQKKLEHDIAIIRETTEAREKAVQATEWGDIEQAEHELGRSLRNLVVILGENTELGADKNFTALYNALREVEISIGSARKHHNSIVKDYNTRCDSFPSMIVARLLGLTKEDFFLTAADEEELPKLGSTAG